MKTRLDMWKNPKKIMPSIIGSKGQELSKFLQKIKIKDNTLNNRIKNDESALSAFDIIESCKEIIFSIVDGTPEFHYIMYTIDSDEGTIVISPLMKSVMENVSEDEIEESVRRTLAIASAIGIQVSNCS